MPSGAKFIEIGVSYIGTPYKLGGTTQSGMDCSNFVYKVLKEAGVKTAKYHTAADIAGGALERDDKKWKEVTGKTAKAGDVFAWEEAGETSDGQSYTGHCGFMTGPGGILDCSSSGGGVRLRSGNPKGTRWRYNDEVPVWAIPDFNMDSAD